MAMFSRRSKISADMVGDSAMSDVAFLLLIFFIVSTTFPEIGLPLILPSAAGDVRQIKRENVMQVVTARSGAHFINLEETPTELTEIKLLLKERLADNDKLIISIETHPDAPYGSMVEVLDAVWVVYDELRQEGVKREKRISLKALGLE